eukprot:g70286.t1
MRDSGLHGSARKLRLGYRELNILGERCSKKGIAADSSKVDAILKLADPSNVSELGGKEQEVLQEIPKALAVKGVLHPWQRQWRHERRWFDPLKLVALCSSLLTALLAAFPLIFISSLLVLTFVSMQFNCSSIFPYLLLSSDPSRKLLQKLYGCESIVQTPLYNIVRM